VLLIRDIAAADSGPGVNASGATRGTGGPVGGEDLLSGGTITRASEAVMVASLRALAVIYARWTKEVRHCVCLPCLPVPVVRCHRFPPRPLSVLPRRSHGAACRCTCTLDVRQIPPSRTLDFFMRFVIPRYPPAVRAEAWMAVFRVNVMPLYDVFMAEEAIEDEVNAEESIVNDLQTRQRARTQWLCLLMRLLSELCSMRVGSVAEAEFKRLVALHLYEYQVGVAACPRGLVSVGDRIVCCVHGDCYPAS
jgi:hypothetical protein